MPGMPGTGAARWVLGWASIQERMLCVVGGANLAVRLRGHSAYQVLRSTRLLSLRRECRHISAEIFRFRSVPSVVVAGRRGHESSAACDASLDGTRPAWWKETAGWWAVWSLEPT